MSTDCGLHSSTCQTMGRAGSPIFTVHKCEQLARSWLACSQCSITGAESKSKVFWEKLRAHFKAARDGSGDSVDRTLRSLGSKWSELSRDCNKYPGALSQVKALHISGTIEEEEEQKALEHYQKMDDQGKAFNYMGCWRILKDSPKWQLACEMTQKTVDRVNSRKKSRTLVGSSQETADQVQSSQLESAKELVTERPIGRKRAKQIAALETRALKSKTGLAESNNNRAAAIDRKARALESVLNFQYF